jgi:hypothetical protein
MDLSTLEDNIAQLTDQYLNSLRMTDAEGIGLDPRAGYSVYVSTTAIAVNRNDVRMLDYYGGFEYVDGDDRVDLGDIVVFKNDSSRVQDCIDHYYASH